MSIWLDEILNEAPILTPRDMLRRLCWQMHRYETILSTPGLDFRSTILITEKLDKVHREYRSWYEASELQRWGEQRDALFVEILDRLDSLEAQRKGRDRHV